MCILWNASAVIRLVSEMCSVFFGILSVEQHIFQRSQCCVRFRTFRVYTIIECDWKILRLKETRKYWQSRTYLNIIYRLYSLGLAFLNFRIKSPDHRVLSRSQRRQQQRKKVDFKLSHNRQFFWILFTHTRCDSLPNKPRSCRSFTTTLFTTGINSTLLVSARARFNF